MCGIFGLALNGQSLLSPGDLPLAASALMRLSESRGKEAAGLAGIRGGEIRVAKLPLPASAFLKSRECRDLLGWLSREGREPMAAMGHSRLVTNGLQAVYHNNQPVLKDGLVGVHNGIICNDERLWADHPRMVRRYGVDTEVILSLVRLHLDQGDDLPRALGRAFQLMEGSASLALLAEDLDCLALASNTGSLYLLRGRESPLAVFASERYILERLAAQRRFRPLLGSHEITQIAPGQGALIHLPSLEVFRFALADPKPAPAWGLAKSGPRNRLTDAWVQDREARAALRRCAKCVLPETVPFIEFDEQGVCSHCRGYQPMAEVGRPALEELLARKRRSDGRPDCIVTLSGGRDSCYGLHYVKKVLGMNPVAFTYDWAMVTDLARRNQARMCGKLGVEQILVSADIKAKRQNIGRNVRAWLRRPHLGMIPLFMAGDKQYFHHAEMLRRRLGVEAVFFFSNRLERTMFKSGFLGVREGSGWYFNLPVLGKLRLLFNYARQIALNPAYLNRSLGDTLFSFYSTYLQTHPIVWFYDYIPWRENEIGDTLRTEYNWEEAGDTENTWRIGDGSAAFYNYIYHTVAGFSEFDTFRSNQVREGLITREQALEMVARDNQPRYDSMREYCYLIGVDFDEAVRVINAIPKLYLQPPLQAS